ncbi:MAG: hypothetical protein HZA50_11725 [Planctomycetes bacterium]|nr:hypothetical protein [Planctomycetota bacterium]
MIRTCRTCRLFLQVEKSGCGDCLADLPKCALKMVCTTKDTRPCKFWRWNFGGLLRPKSKDGR